MCTLGILIETSDGVRSLQCKHALLAVLPPSPITETIIAATDAIRDRGFVPLVVEVAEGMFAVEAVELSDVAPAAKA